MTKTSHKKNRPFDFKLIDLVEPNPVLYMRQMHGMTAFEVMKTKNLLWQQISAEMGYSVQFCLSRWNNLRGQFQKELKHSNELSADTGIIKGSTWPYLNRLRFLECTVQANKPKKLRIPKRKVKTSPQIENQNLSPIQQPEKEEPDIYYSEEYNDFRIEDITDQVDPSDLIEETYVDDYSMIEEIAEEVVNTDMIIVQTDEFLDNTSVDNTHKIQALLLSFEGETLQRIERRLMAFLCKCQLRALGEQTIDDLLV